MGVCVQQHFDIGHSLSFEVCFTLIIEWRSQRGATPQQQYGNPLYIYIYIYIYMHTHTHTYTNCRRIYIYIYIYIYVCSLLPFMSDVTTTVDCSSTPCHSAHTQTSVVWWQTAVLLVTEGAMPHWHTQLAAVLYVHTISCYSATVKWLDYF